MAMNSQCGCSETGPDFCCKCADLKDNYMVTAYDNEEQDTLEVIKENNQLRKNNVKLTQQVKELQEKAKETYIQLINLSQLYLHYKSMVEPDEADGSLHNLISGE